MARAVPTFQPQAELSVSVRGGRRGVDNATNIPNISSNICNSYIEINLRLKWSRDEFVLFISIYSVMIFS